MFVLRHLICCWLLSSTGSRRSQNGIGFHEHTIIAAVVLSTPRPNLVASTQTIRLPKGVVEEMYRASIRFAEVLETLEVLLDKDTMRRIKLGEEQLRRKQYVTAKGPKEIRRALSS